MTLAQYIDKTTITDITQTNNPRASFDLFVRFFISSMLLLGAAHNINSSPALAALFMYFYAIQLSFWGYAGLGHEAFHQKIFSSKRANKLLFDLCSALTWSNGAFFKKTHIHHHRKTFSDDDLEAFSEQSWSFIDLIFYLFLDIRLMSRRVSYAFLNSFGYYPDGKKIYDKSIITHAQKILAINFLLLLIVGFLSGSFLIALLVFISPFVGTLFNKVLAKSQHYNLYEYKDKGPLKYSRTLKLPLAISFFYANMNYHAEHHLAPSVPYYNLPKLHKLLKDSGHISSHSLFEFLYEWIFRKPSTNKSQK